MGNSRSNEDGGTSLSRASLALVERFCPVFNENRILEEVNDFVSDEQWLTSRQLPSAPFTIVSAVTSLGGIRLKSRDFLHDKLYDVVAKASETQRTLIISCGSDGWRLRARDPQHVALTDVYRAMDRTGEGKLSLSDFLAWIDEDSVDIGTDKWPLSGRGAAGGAGGAGAAGSDAQGRVRAGSELPPARALGKSTPADGSERRRSFSSRTPRQHAERELFSTLAKGGDFVALADFQQHFAAWSVRRMRLSTWRLFRNREQRLGESKKAAVGSTSPSDASAGSASAIMSMLPPQKPSIAMVAVMVERRELGNRLQALLVTFGYERFSTSLTNVIVTYMLGDVICERCGETFEWNARGDTPCEELSYVHWRGRPITTVHVQHKMIIRG